MDFLGWYSTGDSPGVQEIAVHQQISDINESPLFLQVSMLTARPLWKSLDMHVIGYNVTLDGPWSFLNRPACVTVRVCDRHGQPPGGHQLWAIQFISFYKSRCNWFEQARMLFVKLPYPLATEEAERIGLDHVARFALDSISINVKVNL